MQRLYLVTGANGHVGYSLVSMLRNQAKHVRGLILPKDTSSRLDQLGIEVYRGDVTKPETLDAFFDLSNTAYQNNDVVVIHTAGIISISNKKNPLLEKVNIQGTRNMIDMSMKHHIGLFIHVSSVHAIPEKPEQSTIEEVQFFDPNLVVGVYAKSKAKASQDVLDAISRGLPAIIVHPSGIIGPDDIGHGHMTMMIEDYLNGFLTSRVQGAYDFVDVRDVSKGIIQAIEHGRIGSCYILSGHRIDLFDLFENLRMLSGRKHKIHVLPRWFASMTVPLAELFYRMRKLPPIYSKYSLYTLSSNSYFSHKKATEELGYMPRPIEETLRDTVIWMAEVNRVKRTRIKSFIQQFITLKKKSGA